LITQAGIWLAISCVSRAEVLSDACGVLNHSQGSFGTLDANRSEKLMSKERTKFDSIIERAVNDEIIAGLRRREEEIRDSLEFLCWYAEQDFDEDVGEFDAPDDEPEDDDDEYIERERKVAEDIAYILPFYSEEEGDDDVWLFEETEDYDEDEDDWLNEE
jgi:hypothetical protein